MNLEKFTKKLLIGFALSIILSVCFTVRAWQYDGDIMLINSAADFYAMAGGNPGGVYRLETDITLNKPWLTSEKHSFKGATIDGNNKTITVEIVGDENPKKKQDKFVGGLFGYVSGNLIIYDLTVKGTVTTTPGSNSSSYTGGLIGYSAGTLDLQRIQVNVDVFGKRIVGGVVGGVFVDKAHAKRSGVHLIKDIAFNGKVTGKTLVGGIVGQVLTETLIEHCRVTGDPTTVTRYNSEHNMLDASQRHFEFIVGENYVGGIVGEMKVGTIKDCYSSVGISGKKVNKYSSSKYIGGIAGNASTYVFDKTIRLAAQLINSFSTGDIHGGTMVGGVTGSTAGKGITSVSQAERVVLDGCWSTSDIISEGSGKTGGLVGSNGTNKAFGIVQNCYALNKSISALKGPKSFGIVCGTDAPKFKKVAPDCFPNNKVLATTETNSDGTTRRVSTATLSFQLGYDIGTVFAQSGKANKHGEEAVPPVNEQSIEELLLRKSNWKIGIDIPTPDGNYDHCLSSMDVYNAFKDTYSDKITYNGRYWGETITVTVGNGGGRTVIEALINLLQEKISAANTNENFKGATIDKTKKDEGKFNISKPGDAIYWGYVHTDYTYIVVVEEEVQD